MWMHPDHVLDYSLDRAARMRAEAAKSRLAEELAEAPRTQEPEPTPTVEQTRPSRWPTWLLAPLRLP